MAGRSSSSATGTIRCSHFRSSKPYWALACYDREGDGSFSGSLDRIDLVANAPSLAELKRALAHDLVECAHEYMEDYALHAHAPNRREHLLYVLRVLIQPDDEGVAALIDA